MIAIQPAKGGFSSEWINYCNDRGIKYKIVNCYDNDIISHLKGCNFFMWQFYQGSPLDITMAKELLFALEQSGIKVFPDFNTAWHFDDKLGQKYLLEAIEAPLVNTAIFYSRDEALHWASYADFPKVFKLRNGAGSQNVRMIKSRREAYCHIKEAFGKGFKAYDPMGSLKERWRKFKLGNTDFRDLLEGIARFIAPPPYARIRGRERGYIYFQDFIPNNDHDIRVVVIKDKAFAIRRMVRKNDFRASGSGDVLYDHNLIGNDLIALSFKLADKLHSQCIAFDYLRKGSEPVLIEISYGFIPLVYSPCQGYWDKDLAWHEGQFNPYGWMVENLINSVLTTDISATGNV